MPNFVIPEYYDGSASHRAGCPECQAIYERLRADDNPRHGAPPPLRTPNKLTWREKMGSRGYNAALLGFKTLTEPRNDTVYFGVELEVEYTDGGWSRNHVDEYETLERKFGDFCITKGDGSLTCGMEINTAPATLGFHKVWNWGETLKMITAAGFKAASTCGLHIHVSRAPLGELRVNRIARFVYNPDNFAFMRYIAGRHSSRWAQIKNVDASNNANVRRGGKYMALNVYPSETIEFRLFAATLQPHRFMSRLEFVAALVEFSGLSAGQVGEADYADLEKFMTWVATKRRTYPNLFRKVRKFRLSDETVKKYGYKPRAPRGFRANAS